MRDKNLLLPSLISRRARGNPDRVFLQEVDGESFTYREYDDAILRWAEALRQIGVTPGDHVVTMLPTSAAASCAWLGLAWLRAIEAPCNTAYRGRSLGYLIENSQAKAVVIADRFLARLPEVAGALENVHTVVVVGSDHDDVDLPCRVVEEKDFFAGIEPAVDLAGPEHSDVCALVYTSGTTGASKGVLSPWAQVYAQAITTFSLEDYNDTDVAYLPYPMHHITGRQPLFLMALVNGRVVIRERFDTASFWSDIDRYGCTTGVLLGAMAAFLWQQEPRDDDLRHPLKNVFMVPLVPYIDEFKSRFGVRVSTGFGSTEQGPAIQTGWNTSSETWKSCGKFRSGYSGFEVRVVDDNDYEVRPGEVGELIIRSSEPWTMSLGYFGMPDKTAEAWRNGWFHTGDAFIHESDGSFYFVDRVKDCIRRRGENISSFEIEAEVNEHPLVLECAAIGVPSEFGEEDVKVLVVVEPGTTLPPEELTDFLLQRMPRFMVPRYVEFVSELPKTEATLRIQKYLLHENALNDATWDRDKAETTLVAQPRD